MAISKITLNGVTQIDLTQDTVEASNTASGVTGHKNDGTSFTGSIATKSASDITASGATVTVPAGLYATQATKTVASGSATPAATISATGSTVSTGTNTLTLSKTVSNTPTVSAGYVSSGTAGNSNVSLTATVTTKAAATITPTTTAQTIASGTYLTGTQTISGDANLVAGNIKKDVSIFGVTGSLEGSSKNAQIASGVGRVNTTTYTAVSGQSLTVAKTGTYDVYWTGYRSSTSGTNGSQLYVGGSAHSSGAQTAFNDTYTNVQNVHLTNVSLTKDQTVQVYARARSTSYYMYIMDLTIIEA